MRLQQLNSRLNNNNNVDMKDENKTNDPPTGTAGNCHEVVKSSGQQRRRESHLLLWSK